jgi:hypothetical protein
MLFRAIFWIGLVAVLMPHEPDLGFGRPASPGVGVTSDVTAWAKDKLQSNLKAPEVLCHGNATACAAGASFLDNIRGAALHSLAEVKADIRQNSRKTVLEH